MKKSLLLLSLLVSVNIFSVNPNIPHSEDEVKQVSQHTNQGPHRKAAETHEDYLNAHGGSLPLVPAYQTAEQKHLHKAVAGKTTTKTTASSRQTRRAARRAARQAARATTAAKTVVR